MRAVVAVDWLRSLDRSQHMVIASIMIWLVCMFAGLWCYGFFGFLGGVWVGSLVVYCMLWLYGAFETPLRHTEEGG